MWKKQGLDAEKQKLIKLLEVTIGIWSLKATKPINDAWASVTGEDPVSWQSNYTVRFEMLFFFLHMMNRYAFQIGGSEVRARLQDAIVPEAILEMIKSSFRRGPHVKKNFDEKKWHADMFNKELERMNEAEMDYSSCTRLGVERHGEYLREETILGKLAARINRLTGKEFNLNLRLLIWSTAVESLAKSGLKKQVEKACSILRT